jgi:hypothetical protein
MLLLPAEEEVFRSLLDARHRYADGGGTGEAEEGRLTETKPTGGDATN